MHGRITEEGQYEPSFWLPQPERKRMGDWKPALHAALVVFTTLLALGMLVYGLFVL
jgi:hypothetical protein